MATESKSVTVYPLNGSNYPTWKIQCQLALMKEGLWNIVSGSESAPEAGGDRHTKFMARRYRTLATIVLSVDPSLLYVIGSPEDPVKVWRKLADQFQKKTWANKLELRHKLYSLRLKDGDSVHCHKKTITEVFDGLSMVVDPISEEDRVVYLLASLPESYSMLVTAVEANAEVPKMEPVTERLLHQERKLKGREEASASSEKVMVTDTRREVQNVTTVENLATSRGTSRVLLSGRRVKLTRVPSRKLTQQELNGRTAALTVSVGLVVQHAMSSHSGKLPG